MSERFSDLLIIGCEISGLIAGAFLAKRGLSVMVLDTDEPTPDRKRNIQPNLISHLDSLLFRKILGRLSISDGELGIVHRYDSPYQVLLPNHRIDVTTQRERFYRELVREFPEQATAIRDFYSNLDRLDQNLDSTRLQELILPDGLLQSYRFRRFVHENRLDLTLSDWMQIFHLDESVRAFLEAQTLLLSNLRSKTPFSYPLAKLLANQNSVLFDLKGGLGQLRNLFLGKIESFAGKVRQGVKIAKIETEKRFVNGIHLDGFEGRIACRYLLWNQNASTIRPALPDSVFARWLSRSIDTVPPKFYRFSVQYQVDPEVIPVGLKGNALLIEDPASPLFGANFLHLHFYYPREEEGEEKRHLIVTYLVEAKSLTEPKSYFDAIHESITAALHRLMPFSENRIRLVFPASEEDLEPGQSMFQDVFEPSDFEIFLKNAKRNPVYEVNAHSFKDLFPFPHRKLFRNLFFTGPEVLSALGFAGSFLLGLKTTDLIWSDFDAARRKKRTKRRW